MCGGGLWVGGMRVTPVSHTLIKLLTKLTLLSSPLLSSSSHSPPLSHFLLSLSSSRLPSLSSLCPPLSLPVVLFPLILLDSFLSLSLSLSLSLCPTWLTHSKYHCSRWCCVCIRPGLLATLSLPLSLSVSLSLSIFPKTERWRSWCHALSGSAMPTPSSVSFDWPERLSVLMSMFTSAPTVSR